MLGKTNDCCAFLQMEKGDGWRFYLLEGPWILQDYRDLRYVLKVPRRKLIDDSIFNSLQNLETSAGQKKCPQGTKNVRRA